MKIYTKTGDRGETSLRWGTRISKDDARVEAYGTVDEANAAIGLALAHLQLTNGLEPDQAQAADQLNLLCTVLTRVQRELFDVGADLAIPPDRNRGERSKVHDGLITQMEQDIDTLSSLLPPLKKFILPGGSVPGAVLQTARTISRRAERRLVSLGRREEVDPILIGYLNRLSDLLFVAARTANQALGVPDPLVLF